MKKFITGLMAVLFKAGFIVSLVLSVLKILNLITYSWWLILSPFIVWGLLFVLAMLGIGVTTFLIEKDKGNDIR